MNCFRKNIEILNYNYKKPIIEDLETHSSKSRITHPASNDYLLQAVNQLTLKVQSMDDDLKKVSGRSTPSSKSEKTRTPLNGIDLEQKQKNSSDISSKSKKPEKEVRLEKPKTALTNECQIPTPKAAAKEPSKTANMKSPPKKEASKSLRAK